MHGGSGGLDNLQEARYSAFPAAAAIHGRSHSSTALQDVGCG